MENIKKELEEVKKELEKLKAYKSGDMCRGAIDEQYAAIAETILTQMEKLVKDIDKIN